eukprot:TRINITY_DN27404_c0_g1_i1.p1 TRINITY_DN27404_c0_g1~~TRINITY_DN27404_c0_g1_i1.p1  ORF type:complete len:802 (+),score=199.80 TRINITY_DN27404_c0_g1_i1:61-2466(+)
MPVSATRGSNRYSSPLKVHDGSDGVVPPIKMPLLHALLRGQSPTNSKRGNTTPSRRQEKVQALYTPQTPSSPRLGRQTSSFYRSPISPRYPSAASVVSQTQQNQTPVRKHSNGSSTYTNDTIGYSSTDSCEASVSRRFNTPGRAPSPGQLLRQNSNISIGERRRAMSAHATRKVSSSTTTGTPASAQSEYLKKLLASAEQVSSPRKNLTRQLSRGLFTSNANSGSPSTPTTPRGRNNDHSSLSAMRSPATPVGTPPQGSSNWSSPHHHSLHMTGSQQTSANNSPDTAAMLLKRLSRNGSQNSLRQQIAAHNAPSTPTHRPAASAAASAATPAATSPAVATPTTNSMLPTGRKVPSHISNMVCSWTANGQEDQAKYGENGYMRVTRGQVFNDRYHIISKLGWGEFATVWLAWDEESLKKKLTTTTSQFVAIKVSKCADHVSNAAMEEAGLLKHIGKYAKQPGASSLSTVLSVFEQKGEYGKHICMVFPVLGQNTLCLVEQAHKYRNKIRGISNPAMAPRRSSDDIAFVKSCLRACLRAIAELGRLHIVHTDLKPENILLTTVSKKTREQMRDWQNEVAIQRNTPWDPERLVNPDGASSDAESSYIRVSDFGLSSLLDPNASQYGIGCHARRLQSRKKGHANNPLGVILQTREYRAPEVLLGNPITPATDVWSIGCMAYELVTGTFLMDPKKDPKRRQKPEEEINADHICMMQQLIGEVPVSITKQGGRHVPTYFNSEGTFRHQEKFNKYFPMRKLSAELQFFLKDKDADLMANFITECLGSYDATLRPAAEVMLRHPFLNTK